MEEVLTFEEALSVLITGSILLLITSFFAWKKGFYKIEKIPDEQPLPLKIVLKAFAIFIVLSAFLVPSTFAFGLYLYNGNLNLSPKMIVIVSSVAIITTFLALVSFQYLQTPKNRELIFGRYFGISVRKSVKDILIGVLTWGLSFPAVMVFGKIVYLILFSFGIHVVPNQVAVSQVKAVLSSPLLFTLIATNIIVFVPILEEFLFRGCLQTWMRGKMGLSKAIILTSLIFASFHFSMLQGLGNIELLVSLFVLSCFLGFIYEKQHSLLASISLHAFFNAVTVLMIYTS